MHEGRLRLGITEIKAETADAVSFVLQPSNGDILPYKAGQFITLVFNQHGREIRRSYSFSSTPGVDKHTSITVKRVHNGEISRRLIDYYKVGDELQAIAPAGMFILPAALRNTQTVFLLAAGSGITPVFSILKQLLFQTNVVKVVLLYQNHSFDSSIFRNELQQLKDNFPGRFVWLDFISVSGAAHKKITNDYLEVLVGAQLRGEQQNALFYICGPASFMRMCQFTLRLMGFDESQIRKEYFVIDNPPPPPLIQNAVPRQVTVYAGNDIIQYQTTYPATILQSALDNRISLPYSCKGGRCSACAAICKSGEVLMSMNDVLTDEDIARGLVLTCVGYALTDVELFYPGKNQPGASSFG